MRRRLLPLLLLVPLLAAGDCPGPDPEPEPTPDEREPCITEGLTECADDVHRTCTEGYWNVNEVCAAPDPQCNVAIGCTGCGPSQRYCVDDAVYECNGEGTDWEQVQDCGDSSCLWGECYDLCDLAAETGSYLGCEFLAVPSSNSLLFGFDDDFAIVLGNPDPERSATIQITRAGEVMVDSILPPEGTRAYPLPYVHELKNELVSQVVPQGAYEVQSSIPVVAYQYNPLNFSTPDQGFYSYTNDASLLLPVAALGQDHIASTMPTFGIVDIGTWTWSPGFIAVAAAYDGTTVQVTSAAHTIGGGIAALNPGEQTSVTLNRGDVLQMFSEASGSSCAAVGGEEGNAEISGTPFPVCLSHERGDLTGSWIASSRPVAVWAGHDCTFIPFDRWACDHLEESMLPLEVWGTDAVFSAPVIPGGSTWAPTKVRIIAQQDDTLVTFTPPVAAPTTAGPFTPIELDIAEDVMVTADGPILAMQYLLGEQALGTFAGDPAMGVMPPTNHWRSSYDFLVPDTYESDYVNIVARFGATVYLDGVEVTAWSLIEDTPYKVHRAQLQPGPHNAFSKGASPFGLTAYGYASYTSYLYPGGLDLTHNPQP